MRMELERQRKLEEDMNNMKLNQFKEEQRTRIEREMKEQMDREALERYRAEEQRVQNEQRDRENQLIGKVTELREISRALLNQHGQLMRQKEDLENESKNIPTFEYDAQAMMSYLRGLQEQAERLRQENTRLKLELGPEETKFLKLRVMVKEGRAMRAMDILGKCDPYVKLTLESQEYKTHTKRRTQHPQWNQEFELFVNEHRPGVLEISCWHDSIGKDECMGHALFSLEGFSVGSTTSRWFNLTPRTSGGKAGGEINVTLTLYPSN